VAHIYVEITAAEAQALAAQLSEEGN